MTTDPQSMTIPELRQAGRALVAEAKAVRRLADGHVPGPVPVELDARAAELDAAAAVFGREIARRVIRS